MLAPESSSTLPTVTVVSGRPFVVFSLENPVQQEAHGPEHTPAVRLGFLFRYCELSFFVMSPIRNRIA